jgi:glycosyltransferase involved in cell wall biosynthesis
MQRTDRDSMGAPRESLRDSSSGASEKRSLVLLTGNHLCHNPRVLKVATSLGLWGWNVEVLGAWISADLKRRDQLLMEGLPFRFTPVFDLAVAGARAASRRLLFRIERNLASRLYAAGRVPSRALLGYGATTLDRVARRRAADLFVAHSEAALWVARRLLAKRRNVGVDMEDWYSEDLLPEARKTRPTELLRQLESEVLATGAFSSSPSRSMSEALANEFNCRPPEVVLNAFPWKDRTLLDGVRKDREGGSSTALHWYSQTLGPGRGLESLIAALPKLTRPVDIYFRGVPVAGFESWLGSLVPSGWRGRIVLLGLVSNSELLSRIAEYDIGLAAELKYCRSRDLTITNKILQYLLAGLAVAASDTAGQREVASRAPAAVHIYKSGDSESLAACLNQLLDSPELLARSKSAALGAAESVFTWEHQEPRLRERLLAAARAKRADGSESSTAGIAWWRRR